MKYRIVKYMTAWAIERKDLFFWNFIRHGDYWPTCTDKDEGRVMEFGTKEKAESYLLEDLRVERKFIS